LGYVPDAKTVILDAIDSGQLEHMPSGARALLVAPFVTTTHGGARHQKLEPVRYRAATIRELAPAVGVGIKTLGYAVKLHRSGRADLVDDVAAGRMSLAEAVRRL